MSLRSYIHSFTLLTLLFLFCACQTKQGEPSIPPVAPAVTESASPPKAPSPPIEPADPIEGIRTSYASIEAQLKNGVLQRDSLNYECVNDPLGGDILIFTKAGETQYIEHNFYAGDHGGGIRKYYLQNNELIFAFYLDSSWYFDAPTDGEGKPGTRDEIAEYRFYYDGQGGILRSMEKKYSIRSSDEQAVDPDAVENVRSEDLDLALIAMEEFADLRAAITRGDLAGNYCME